ncbi:hypothetical protein BN946_scf184979.g58 [Trametes cinnabarina]|uniref:Uncharacterized protein n=1 Tax=Pycnoporus cinnabarinus TaxID=5643 RepID=A0A060SPY1_PYCCI|nr:hypothetical protein BN946_scf184979.g58 [Trametes cinnabarina]
MFTAVDDPTTLHGLNYPQSFLDSLPVLRPRPEPHPPIRSLNAAQFSDLHFAHLTSHAPDHVLFPFLHGLEGDNEQQNAFFASSRPKGEVPRFRGLVWVACDEDEDIVCDVDELDDDDDDDDDYSSSSSLDSFGPTDLDEDVPMELDPSVEGPLIKGCPPPKPLEKIPTTPSPVPITAAQLPSNHTSSSTHAKPAHLTCSFRPRDLLRTRTDERGTANVFVEPKIPDGISLRNFGIQVPIYATISDIVVYSPRGATKSAVAVAEKFKQAIELKLEERRARCPNPDALVLYNVFVLDASASEMTEKLPHLVVRTEDAYPSGAHTDGTDAHTHGEGDDTTRLLRANTIDFAQREKDEMRDLTQASEIVSVVDPQSNIDPLALAGSNTASHWEPSVGQIFLGNSNDVPLPPDRRIRMRTLRNEDEDEDTFDWRTNDPGQGFGYDICVECHDYAPFPTSAHLRAAEEHLRVLEKRWIERCVADMDSVDPKAPIPLRPPPSASHVVHLPFPSSPASSVVTTNTILPFIAFLERLMQPLGSSSLTYEVAIQHLAPPRAQNSYDVHNRRNTSAGFTPSSLPPPNSFPTSFFPSSPSPPSSAYTRVRSTSATFHPASSPSTPVSTSPTSGAPVPLRTRPVKILIYSADGYTESSVLALCILMATRGISLPEAYLTLQVEKRRSFFVYQSDLGVLRRIEARLEKERATQSQEQHRNAVSSSNEVGRSLDATKVGGEDESHAQSSQGWVRSLGRAAAKSVSFVSAPMLDEAVDHSPGTSAPSAVSSMRSRSESEGDTAGQQTPTPGRPRAHTMPPTRMPPWKDHQAWFNDPRFDGSFPSRVLPFLYLGNLNHASNAFMLHALGITHVVSVGECALVPPPHLESANSANGAPACSLPGSGAQFVPGKGPGGQGSLWIEEREGRIKVLDIKGVCDDGIDTLEPQLEPICEWIDKAREEGGKVLVHCRVGVSRSATVTIAYVMKHLSLPLVDAYLIVRSRRLSVLIQPNMRLLYNLLGWEVKLARERTMAAFSDEKCAGLSEAEKEERRKTRLQCELARALNWPFLAKEVHALNEKYLH